jgi:hypothetical protein
MTNPGQDLSEIRSMMEKSSKILSLSGLAGIVVGCIAIGGVVYARSVLASLPPDQLVTPLVIDALVVLVAAIAAAVFFSGRMARQKGLPVWNATAKHLVTELAVPLLTGGLLSLALLIHQAYAFLPSTMLVFYGLALFTASKYTVREVRMLGITEVAIGIAAAFVDGQGLYLWALGFGVANILFGIRIYLAYER